MSEYDNVLKGSLKLKKSALSAEPAIKKKKKKKKSLELKRVLEQDVTTGRDNSCDSSDSGSRFKSGGDKKTKAEMAFQKAKEARMVKDITTKVLKSHKERIMEFNENLDNMSEHYDIPKVSWTK